jgi:hypothetical protein
MMIEGSGSIPPDYWIRIRKAQKHVDPDPAPDPEHCFSCSKIGTSSVKYQLCLFPQLDEVRWFLLKGKYSK